jgi:hypothetical protein
LPEWGISIISGGLDAELTSEFREIASAASYGVGCPPAADAVDFWLHCLCEEMRSRPTAYPGLFTESVSDGVIIHDLLSASISYCSRLAEVASSKTQHRTENDPPTKLELDGATPPPAPQKKRGRPVQIDSARKEAALSAREAGKGGKEVAKALYGVLYPTEQQVKNAPNVLNNYERTRVPPPNNS